MVCFVKFCLNTVCCSSSHYTIVRVLKCWFMFLLIPPDYVFPFETWSEDVLRHLTDLHNSQSLSINVLTSATSRKLSELIKHEEQSLKRRILQLSMLTRTTWKMKMCCVFGVRSYMSDPRSTVSGVDADKELQSHHRVMWRIQVVGLANFFLNITLL